jgi:hypothetical protein
VNRRAFLAKVAGVVGAATAAPMVATAAALPPALPGVLTYKGAALACDSAFPGDAVFFLNPRYPAWDDHDLHWHMHRALLEHSRPVLGRVTGIT